LQAAAETLGRDALDYGTYQGNYGGGTRLCRDDGWGAKKPAMPAQTDDGFPALRFDPNKFYCPFVDKIYVICRCTLLKQFRTRAIDANHSEFAKLSLKVQDLRRK